MIKSFSSTVTEKIFNGDALTKKDRKSIGSLNVAKAQERLVQLNTADQKVLLKIEDTHTKLITTNIMNREINKVPRCSSKPACGLVADTIEHYGLSQAEVARAMKVSPGLLSDIVKGKKGLSAEFALRFEKCLGVSAEWLYHSLSYLSRMIIFSGG
jgi:addiction module HigA family antidote